MGTRARINVMTPKEMKKIATFIEALNRMEGNKIMTHTPGPWGIEHGDEFEIVSRSPHLSATVAIVAARIPSETARADASLIAAAPELLEALKTARECIAYCRRAHSDAQSGDGIPVEVFIDAAIAKAEGNL